MLISLGNSCKVRAAIYRHTTPSGWETNMFDWVISNFDSVLYFLKNIDKPINKDDFEDTGRLCGPHRIMRNKKIRFESVHDVQGDNPYDEEMQGFIAKYERRLRRLKGLIENEPEIHFLHLVDFIRDDLHLEKKIHIPTKEDIKEFHQAIKNINPNSKYYLHILIPPSHCKYYDGFQKFEFEYNKEEVNNLSSSLNNPKNGNVLVHFLTQDENLEHHTHECRHWSWPDVFEVLKSKGIPLKKTLKI